MIIEDINLKKIFDSGQVFNWYDMGDFYIVPIKASLFSLKQKFDNSAELTLLEGEELKLDYYFDVSSDYISLYKKISTQYPELSEAVSMCSGMRLLLQDPFEVIITFLLSANNNIPRIKGSINYIREGCGKKISSFKGKDFYKFPSPNELLVFDLEDYKKAGAGYRAPYLYSSVKDIASDSEFNTWKNLETKKLIENLKKLKGVGPKVAHCIALYGYGKRDVFPVDTWIKKALKNFYDIENLSEKQIEEKLLNKYGNLSALVQQVMFYYQKEKA